MPVASPDPFMIATMLGGWESVVIMGMLLLLLGAKKIPEIMRGMGYGVSLIRKELDDLAQDAGKSAGGIFGKPAAEALTPDNQTAELYDPAAFRRGGRKRSVHRLFWEVWQRLVSWLRIKH